VYKGHVYYPGSYYETLKKVLEWDNADVLAGLDQGDVSIMDFLLYVMSLRGAKHKEQFPKVRLPMAQSGVLSKLYDKLHLPRALRRLVDQCANMYPPFAPALIVAWSYLEGIEFRDNPFPKPDFTTIDGILSAGFDQHTQAGKRAYAYVRKSTPEWFQEVPDNSLEIFGHIIFRTESGWLDQHVSNDAFDTLYWSALKEFWYHEGWSEKEALATCERVCEDYAPLHKARKRIWS